MPDPTADAGEMNQPVILTLVRPTAAGLAVLYTRLTGKPATEEEMQRLLDEAHARKGMKAKG